MSISDLGIGMAAVAAVVSTALQLVLPQPAPLVINNLTYADGIVTQDRTLNTDQPAFYAQWTATVENAETGESLRWCEGSGANGYPPGQKAVTFTLADWTGRATCTPDSLPPGLYALRASWRWGAESTSFKSAVFEVKP